MRLSDIDILKRMASGSIRMVPPPSEACIGSFSIDVRLGHHFRMFHHARTPFLDLSDAKGAFAFSEKSMREVILSENEQFFLHPGEFALGMTQERITLPNDIVGWLDGRSSLARLGLMVHITAHAIDPGWDGHLTFEFFNAGRLPLALTPGLRIGAISFEPLSTPTSRPYGQKHGAKYQGQQDPSPSRIAADNGHDTRSIPSLE
jgi:dCTP deaminase